MKRTYAQLLTSTILAALAPFSIATSAEQAVMGGKKHSLATGNSTTNLVNEVPEQLASPGSSGTPGTLGWFRGFLNGERANVGDQDSFIHPVDCNGVHVGNLDFLSRGFTWRHTKNIAPNQTVRDYGGVRISGGFTRNGNDPCGWLHEPAFHFVQMVHTTNPINGHAANAYYMDVRKGTDPRVSPWYPNGTSRNNNVGGAYTTSYFDAAKRSEKPGFQDWNALNALVCEYDGKINVMAHFEYGYSILQYGVDPDEALTGETDANGDGVHDLLQDGVLESEGGTGFAWSAPRDYTDEASDEVIRELNRLLNPLSGSRKGFAVTKGCCCPETVPTGATSDADGNTTTTFSVPEHEMILAVCIFPRNHPVDFSRANEIEGWDVEEAFFGMPMLAWELEPREMLQNGIYLYPGESIEGPTEFSIEIPLTGHESFLDIYVMDGSGQWRPWVRQTEHLLGDMNDDGVFTEVDMYLLEMAIDDPHQYELFHPDINHIFAGDFGHDGSLDWSDLDALNELVNDVAAESDAVSEYECWADIDLDGQVAIGDLLAVIGAWGDCNACPADTNDDGWVDVSDLLDILSEWGPCSES